MINIEIHEKIQDLKEKLNSAISNSESLTSNEVVALSQELDGLIALESRRRLEKYKSSKEKS
ncbi:aspartyl-phosphate phosphatase Spo0E family protein [Alkaliphilus sp. MSJ-5]|uniref:Aspartyl-phosphate phosphatase Spo0E family protein n=1 Tax=Alkaliphilus flagellatus TaxID=2841507 RepID=A0ABS6G345_9FIRM|nr:aspartyl-phosphate phosphatase Spo0E family protein [Alkaliphilus flagellatus]